MLKTNKTQLTKKDISKNINSKIGLSVSYTDKITDDLILILKQIINIKETNIKNFGTFKIIKKNERLGRNPKNREIHLIKERKSVSFAVSKKLYKNINNV